MKKEPEVDQKPKIDVDFKIATMRRDCMVLAVDCYKTDQSATIFEVAESIYQYITTGKYEPKTKQEWR